MSEERLAAGTVVVLVVIAIAAVASVTASGQAIASAGDERQARVHHEVPGRLLLHARRRREEVGQGDTRSVSVIYAQGKSGTDDAGEIAAIQNMVAQGVKGIAITPTSPAVIPALDKAIKAGRQGRADGQRHPDLEEARASVVATNNFKGGKLAGKWLADASSRPATRSASSREYPASRRSTIASPACSQGSAR